MTKETNVCRRSSMIIFFLILFQSRGISVPGRDRGLGRTFTALVLGFGAKKKNIEHLLTALWLVIFCEG